jgi:Plavaka transposase
MYTGDWWWSVQVRVRIQNVSILSDERSQGSLESRQPGATVVPLIVSTDKTQLTVFGGKMAYPVYMTIGNIPKELRRKPSRCAQVLLGYIPTTKLEGITNKAARRRALANLFHFCLEILFTPIAMHGEAGLPIMSGDGIWRRCHPILANFIGDYPEQALVTCTYYGECPKCEVPCDRLGDCNSFPSRNYGKALDIYALADGNVRTFHAACRDGGIKPVFHPFWESLPAFDVYISITPDVLHQLLQGVMKHLIAWVSNSLIFGRQRINARCQLMPPNHHVVLFPKGITSLTRVSGKEHKNICRVLLGLIVDLQLPAGSSSARLLKAVRGSLDFLYLAQLPSQSSNTICRLERALDMFHENKDVFVDLGVRDHFNVPKIHSLLHYSSSIRLFGTTDNYNTEQTERLHIDFTKDAYRATNHKDEYYQMTTWLERREKLQQHAMFIEWRQRQHLPTSVPPQRPIGTPPQPSLRYLKMTRNPTLRRVPFDAIISNYGAVDFQDVLGDFLAHLREPNVSGRALRNRGENTLIPFQYVPVFHKIKFTDREGTIIDSVHIRPEQLDTHGRIIPARFDTVLIRTGQQPGNTRGNQGRLWSHCYQVKI